jgi:DNA gyrase subunit A
MAAAVEQIALPQAAYDRYLSYALSVITSRALPDVRDGLKPVQRRILYTMHAELGLSADGRYRKCAAVVGEVMGKYHPHGDSSIYEALVRMAQGFSLRAPLVDGQGNFGSLDGDPPAAMRYTECRLTAVAEVLLDELDKNVVDVRPTYDGQRSEPVVLPAPFPQLLVNGVEGIAVGMATKMPPHNLREVVAAAKAVIRNPEIPTAKLLKLLKGPDFPTAGRVLASPAELVDLYETGQGSFRIQAVWDVEKEGRKRNIIVTEIPYATNKAKLLEHIGSVVEQRKLPQIVDVRDESTEEVRIVLELKADASPEAAMAWLFKNTDLQISFAVNMTMLVPTNGSDVASPRRIGLRETLQEWLRFRLATIERRFRHDLQQLRERIHILDGFQRIFDALDEIIALIRASEGKRDAAEKLIQRFALTDVQADAILELRLYRLARLEINIILEELEEKRARADELGRILASEEELWKVIETELEQIAKFHGNERRTRIGGEAELRYDENDYIVKEDAFVVVTREGWVKRQTSLAAIEKVRTREGDSVGWLFRVTTSSTLTVFTDRGSAYTLKVDAIPATTGYGEPVQKQFSFEDGAQIIGVVSHDPRLLPEAGEPPVAVGDEEPPPPGPYAVAVMRGGRVLRFPLAIHHDESTKNGRRFARLDEGDAVMLVAPQHPGERLALATARGRGLVFPADEITVLKAAGKGVTGIKLQEEDDAVFAAALVAGPDDGPVVVANRGDTFHIVASVYAGSRAANGKTLFRDKKTRLVAWKNREPVVATGDAAAEAK